MKFQKFTTLVFAFLAATAVLTGCSDQKVKNQAKETAARYWQDKAYPGKAYDVQVIDAEKDDNGKYRVKGIVDGENRVGTFNPDTENFSEGYYSLAHERDRRIAELEQESKYWKERADDLEKENYKLKVQLTALRGGSIDGVPMGKKFPTPDAPVPAETTVPSPNDGE